MKLLLNENGKRILIDESGLKDDVNTNDGVIKKEDIKEAKEGGMVKTHKGVKYFVIKPGFLDFYKSMKRGPQIITLKDASAIGVYTGISPGMRVLDAGLGSGAMTAYAANLVRPSGMVYSYELREDFIDIGKRNLEKMGLLDYVTIKNKDVYKTIDEKDLDVIVLDVPSPERALKNAKKALKVGGYLAVYVPTITQVSLFCDNLEESGISLIKVIDLIEYPWKVKGKAVRPENMILGHTGFIIITRKMQK